MRGWLKAEEAPKEWEGQEVFLWREGLAEPDRTRLPVGYSREPHHCLGIMLRRCERVPSPPRIGRDRET